MRVRRYSRHPETQRIWGLQTLGHSRHSGNQALKEHLGTEDTLFSKLLKAISLYHTTLLSGWVGPICKHLPPLDSVPQGKIKRIGEEIDFDVRLLDLPLIYQATSSLSLGSFDQLNLYYNYKKESHPTTNVSAFCVSSLRNNPPSVFHVRKSTITESDFSNVAGASLLKSLSLMDFFL